MMDDPLDRLYLEWLYEKVAVTEYEDRDLTYWKVLQILFMKEFVWVVANDENRVHDGVALRSEFLDTVAASADTDLDRSDYEDWASAGCSMLELMVGLSRRLEFEANKGKAHYWFWVLMENIGLSGFSDHKRFTKRLINRIDDILDEVIHRNYEPSGLGGFFPMEDTHWDQRKRELWYQMSEYLWERRLSG